MTQEIVTVKQKTPPDEAYQRARELRTALRVFVRASEQITRRQGLTAERYELLLFIHGESTNGSEGATVSGLSQTLQLAQSSLTQLVRRAENLGLVHRQVSRHDARVRYLRLTAEGEQRLANAVAELGEERAKLTTILNHTTLNTASSATAHGV